jgi:hydroxysqualene synthase
MKSIPPPELRSAYRDCEKTASRHYENFPVASFLLPPESRPHVAALYAFARTADDFADEEAYEGRRLAEINGWEKAFREALRGKSAPPVLRAFAHTLKSFGIPAALPLDLLKAYRMDLTVHRYAAWKDLLHYCRHSADPVGRMVLYIVGVREKRAFELSDFICSGLQLANFWQDTAQDLRRGRIYYPRAEWRKAGIRQPDFSALRDSPGFRHLVRNAVDFAEGHLRKGEPLLEMVRGRLRLELRATYLGGLGILKKIRAIDYNVLQVRPSFTALDKFVLAWKSFLGGSEP